MRDPKFKNVEGYFYTKNLILRSVSAVYLMAFLSFYYQSPGLFGNTGILPARLQVETTGSGKVSTGHNHSTFLLFSSYLGLDTATMMDLLALLGILCSFLGFISQRYCLLSTFAVMWSVYYSLTQVTQTFINQSDQLLLEVGIVCIMIAPMMSAKKRSVTDKIGLLMLKWILFRFMFASGAVKLASGSPHWWNLSGLKHHFETLPLPTPISWYSYYLPESYLKLSTIFVYLSELVCPWLFFGPNRLVRKFAFYWQVYLHLNIIASGNYGFSSFLIISLLFSLLDDSHFYPNKNKKRDITGIIFTLIFLAGLLFMSFKLFGLNYKNGEFISDITFTRPQYMDFMKMSIKLSPFITTIVILSSFLRILINSFTKSSTSIWEKINEISMLLIFTGLSLGLIGVSIVPHGNLHSGTNITNTALGKTYQRLNKLDVVHEYGQHLRKMRSERLEIEIEYAQNIEGPWHEYSFLYKVWNVNNSLPIAGPYFPRFDFKFYDAAGSKHTDNLWISSLIYRLLQNDPDVLMLFGIKEKIKPSPKFVRASLYKFKYTSWAERNNPAYWHRSRLADYHPAYSLEDAALHAYLKALRIPIDYKPKPVKNKILKNILDFIRIQLCKIEGSFLVLGFLAAGFAIIATEKKN